MIKFKHLLFALILTLCFASTGWGADRYLNGACANNGDGTSFTCAAGSGQPGAYNSLANSVSGATAGDTVYISGGASGQTYVTAEPMTFSKNLTFRSVDTADHNGTVTISGSILGSANVTMNWIGTTYNRLKFLGTSVARAHIKSDATGSTTLLENADITGDGTAQYGVLVMNGVWTLRRVHMYSLSEKFYGYVTNVSGGPVTSLNIEYSIFDKHRFSISGTSQTVNVSNSLFIAGATGFTVNNIFEIPNNAAFTFNSINNIYWGSSPVYVAGTLSTITSTNDYYHPSIINGTTYYATFDNKNDATVTDRVTQYSLPYFKSLKNSNFGQIFIRVDDVGSSAKTAAETLNPEIVVTYFSSGNGGMNSTELNSIRWLANNGNEVGSHGKTHAYNDTLNILSAAWSGGTSKEIIVDTTQTGDSTEWTGTLKIVVDGVSCPDATGWDLANASYDTIAEIITLLNSGAGHTCNGATVTVANINGSTSATGMKSTNLADQTLSGDGNLTLNDAAFIRSELTEHILDLEAYITGSTSATPATEGCDRNGDACVSTTEAQKEDYDCTSYASAGGRVRFSMKQALLSAGIKTGNARETYVPWTAVTSYVTGDIVSVNQAGVKYYVCTVAGTSGESVFPLATIGNTVEDNTVTWKRIGIVTSGIIANDDSAPYDFMAGTYQQISGLYDGALFSMAAQASVAPITYQLLWHGEPTFNSSTADLKAFLVHMGVGGETMSEYYDRITGDTHFVHIGNNTYQYDGDSWSTLNSSGDYHLTSPSPAINAGVNICTGADAPLTGCTGAGTGTYTDYTGGMIAGTPDIGAYERRGKFLAQ